MRARFIKRKIKRGGAKLPLSEAGEKKKRRVRDLVRRVENSMLSPGGGKRWEGKKNDIFFPSMTCGPTKRLYDVNTSYSGIYKWRGTLVASGPIQLIARSRGRGITHKVYVEWLTTYPNSRVGRTGATKRHGTFESLHYQAAEFRLGSFETD